MSHRKTVTLTTRCRIRVYFLTEIFFFLSPAGMIGIRLQVIDTFLFWFLSWFKLTSKIVSPYYLGQISNSKFPNNYSFFAKFFMSFCNQIKVWYFKLFVLALSFLCTKCISRKYFHGNYSNGVPSLEFRLHAFKRTARVTGRSHSHWFIFELARWKLNVNSQSLPSWNLLF